MRVTRAYFKYALRFVRNQEDMARADSLAQDLSDQNVDGFWKTMHKMNNCNTILANVINGVSGPDSIASHWKQHFDKLLNVHVHVNSDNSLKDDILSNFDKIKHNPNMSVSTKSVSEIIGKLECGKSAEPDGFGAEYLKFSNIKIHVLLSLCFTLCLAHGYLPPAVIETTIVPIVKKNQVIYRIVVFIDPLHLLQLCLHCLSLFYYVSVQNIYLLLTINLVSNHHTVLIYVSIP